MRADEVTNIAALAGGLEALVSWHHHPGRGVA